MTYLLTNLLQIIAFILLGAIATVLGACLLVLICGACAWIYETVKELYNDQTKGRTLLMKKKDFRITVEALNEEDKDLAGFTDGVFTIDVEGLFLTMLVEEGEDSDRMTTLVTGKFDAEMLANAIYKTPLRDEIMGALAFEMMYQEAINQQNAAQAEASAEAKLAEASEWE